MILFDGVCNFCASSVQFLLRHDKKGIFSFVPIQSSLGRQVYNHSGLNPEDMQTLLLVTKRGTFFRSDAVLEVARELSGIWSMAVVFKIIPRSWRDSLYNFIVRHRYRWFGRRDACIVPSEAQRSRFLA